MAFYRWNSCSSARHRKQSRVTIKINSRKSTEKSANFGGKLTYIYLFEESQKWENE